MRALLLVLLLAPVGSLRAQGAGSLYVVRRGPAELGRETLAVQRATDGTIFTIEARYQAAATRLSATLERTAAGTVHLFKLKVDGGGGPAAILAAGAGSRLVVRSETGGAETGRELPGGKGAVVLDDQLLTLLAAVVDLATPEGARLSGIYPRTGKRLAFTARRTAPDRVELGGELTGSLTLDARALPLRIEVGDLIATFTP